MRLYDVIHERSGNPALVFEYIDSNDADIDDLYKSLSLADIKFYMRELLIALRYLHGAKIIHRDVKPHNVLIDQSRRSLRLIDFGLSVFHTPDADQSIAGSKAYEAPELLVSHHRYDTKVDMWSTGAMLAALMFRRFPMFVGVKSENVLGQIVKVSVFSCE